MQCSRLRRLGHAAAIGGLAMATLAAAGCDDFATPAQLMAPTVVGIIAEPPVVKPGESTRLTPLIAAPDGPQQAAAATWSLVETLPGVSPFGQVIGNPDGSATYRAPREVPPLPENALPLDSVALQMSLGGRITSTLKAVLVTDLATANPAIGEVTADGIEIADGATLELTTGVPVELAVASTPAASDRTLYAWYTSIGEIEDYQSSPCGFLAKTAGRGWLYIVVRDGQLGVAWRAIAVAVR
jgi:hypothetical protein